MSKLTLAQSLELRAYELALKALSREELEHSATLAMELVMIQQNAANAMMRDVITDRLTSLGAAPYTEENK
jgi:hypothetical protein